MLSKGCDAHICTRHHALSSTRAEKRRYHSRLLAVYAVHDDCVQVTETIAVFLLVLRQRNCVHAWYEQAAVAKVSVCALESADTALPVLGIRKLFGFICVSRVDGSASFSHQVGNKRGRAPTPTKKWSSVAAGC
jgi:hypothetical protein